MIKRIIFDLDNTLLFIFPEWEKSYQKFIDKYRLKKYNLDKFFSKIYGWDVLEIKPSKIGIEKIIGNNKIDEYLFIGDSIELDLEIPHNMGMATIFLIENI